MKVLIVDDEIGKAQEITQHLRSEVSDIEVVHCTTSHAARQSLIRERFDALIIDLNLPATLDQGATDQGGFEFLDVLMLDDSASIPHDVIFITGREELIPDARVAAQKYGAILLEYSKKESWRGFLSGRLKHFIRMNRDGAAKSFDLAVVTALGSPELDAVLRLDYHWREFRLRDDPSVYYEGFLNVDERRLSVVAVSANRKGMPVSAALASKVVVKFSPRFLVMLGICAGVKSKTNLGDIVIADPTWDYGSGKYSVDGEGSPVFQAAPVQCSLNAHVRSVVEQLIRDRSLVPAIRAKWEEAVPQGVLSARIGPMASGASVIADDEHARAVALQQRELLAIEMEGYAVMAAAEVAKTTKPASIVIKSVCDFADSKKSDDWQRYAAFTSAQFADSLFRHRDFFQ